MATIGISGHRMLPAAARSRAERDIRALLARQETPVTGLASLAAGADQLFAELLLRAGHRLHVVIPCQGFVGSIDEEPDRKRCQQLRAEAAVVTVLDFDHPSDDAFDAAGKFVVERCDLLVAVWDGQPARGRGGTGDAVAHARALGREVLIAWPEGLRRS
ncbi:hypothetical protein [Amycolatopsis sp. NPDC054798]